MELNVRYGQANRLGDAHNRDGQTPRTDGPALPEICRNPLHTIAQGISAGSGARQFMGCIDAGNQLLGNRAFMHWVGGLHGTRPDRYAAPLQLMPVKRKERKEATAEAAVEKTPAAMPKKKKSRVQVALNMLRGEGLESFRRYVGEEISLVDSLHNLKHRLLRAEDLGNIKPGAVEVVEARLRELDPDSSPAAAEPGLVPDRDKPARARVNLELSPREKAVLDACLSGNRARLVRLLKFGALDVNFGSLHGTLLGLSAFSGHVPIVRELLSAPGIDVNLALHTGVTPLYLASQQGHLEVVRVLVAAPGIKINLPEQFGATPLCIASHYGHKEIVRLLTGLPGIKIDACKDDGATPLFCAAQDNHPDIVELLLQRGADAHRSIRDGSTPLANAAKNGHTEVVRRLLKAPGIQIDQRTNEGVTAVTIASQNGHKEVVRLLLRNGADPNISTVLGATPLHLACLYGHMDIVQMLLHAGADAGRLILIDEGQELTALELAQLGRHWGIMSALESHYHQMPTSTAQPAGASTEEVSGEPAAGMTAAVTGQTPATASATGPGYASAPVPAEPESRTKSADAHTAGPIAPVPLATQPTAGEQPSITSSALNLAKDELIQDILRKLRDDILDPLDGIRIMVDVRGADNLDRLCVVYNRLASIERRNERARRRRGERRKFATPADAAPQETALTFELGEKSGMDADTVEDEIKARLKQSHHRFVRQAVNDMEFGRVKHTSGYPELWHVSAGIAGVGSCSVFFYRDEENQVIRIAGVGHHVGRAAYQLDYATGELEGGGRIISIA